MPSRREGSITQRNKGSWQIRYYSPPDANGKHKRITETVKGLKSDAEKLLRERLAAIENGGYVPRDRETVADFLKRWLKIHAATKTPKTREGYQGNINRYINPAIGRVELQKLAPTQIQGMYAPLLERGLSNRTVLHAHRVLHKALADGVKWGVLVRNPADATTPPRAEEEEMKMWDIPTINLFRKVASDHRFQDFYQLALLTGMRRSELCGLKWESVDLVAGRLSVVRTRQRVAKTDPAEDEPKTAMMVGAPKTRRSRRSIALSPQTVDLLHSIRGKQLAQQLEAGPVWENTDYVLTQPDGRPMNPNQVTKEFKAIVGKAGLPHLTLHGLRHANATLLLVAGVSPKVVSERLGHSNIAITMDTYSHVIPGLQEEAALLLDRLLSEEN